MRKFLIELIKPTHYDDDGYTIQWKKAWVPSNSLGCLYGLCTDLKKRYILYKQLDRNAVFDIHIIEKISNDKIVIYQVIFRNEGVID